MSISVEKSKFNYMVAQLRTTLNGNDSINTVALAKLGIL